MALRYESSHWRGCKEHDLNQLKNLLHGDEEFISGDAGYQGRGKTPRAKR